MAITNYKDITINDIIDWCKENKQTKWLKETAAEQVNTKVYPRKQIINAKGKKVSVADKSQKPTVVKGNKTFITIKREFCEKFMPELLPVAKEKAPTMFDIIAAL